MFQYINPFKKMFHYINVDDDILTTNFKQL